MRVSSRTLAIDDAKRTIRPMIPFLPGFGGHSESVARIGPRAGAWITCHSARSRGAAVQRISGVLALDAVLQLIVDRVRELADAEYAALGIAHPDGVIERFIT